MRTGVASGLKRFREFANMSVSVTSSNTPGASLHSFETKSSRGANFRSLTIGSMMDVSSSAAAFAASMTGPTVGLFHRSRR